MIKVVVLNMFHIENISSIKPLLHIPPPPHHPLNPTPYTSTLPPKQQQQQTSEAIALLKFLQAQREEKESKSWRLVSVHSGDNNPWRFVNVRLHLDSPFLPDNTLRGEISIKSCVRIPVVFVFFCSCHRTGDEASTGTWCMILKFIYSVGL